SSLPLRTLTVDRRRSIYSCPFLMSVRSECAKALVSCVPRFSLTWRKGLHLEGATHHLTPIGEGAENAHAERLRQYVAQRRRLDRPGQHQPITSVGGELIQQCILTAAADDVDDLDSLSGQRFQA